MAASNVSRRPAVQLAAILDSPEIQRFIEDLEAVRWTGRPGYPVRALLGVALAKSLYAIPTWSRTIALVHEHVSRAGFDGGSDPWFRPRGRRVFRDAESEEVSTGVDRARRSADA
jgi:hypothetical protein